jgi:hypothetical protein
MKAWIHKIGQSFKVIPCLLALLVMWGLFFAFFLLAISSPARDIEQQFVSLSVAKERWKQSNLSDYVVHVEAKTTDMYEAFKFAESTCAIDIDVHGKTKAITTANTCGTSSDTLFVQYPGILFNIAGNVPPIVTIDEIFIAIGKVIGKPRPHAPDDPICDSYYLYTPSYDPKLGYPRSIEYVYHEPKPSLFNLAHVCYGKLLIDPTFTEYTISVTPLP